MGGRSLDTFILWEVVFIIATIGGGYALAYPLWLSKWRWLNNTIYGAFMAAIVLGSVGVMCWPFYWWFNGR